ncbi:MAG: TonB-dependent receptor [Kofleriaceae bacterium]|nr:TonB-dependent receptor [Kofleriaceae bacterium]
MQYIVSWAGVFLLVTSPTLAFGQDTVEEGIDESAQEGEVVVITGQKYEEKAILSSTTIDGEALERTRGESFSEALADVPGVSQLRSGSGMSKPIVRGQYGRRLLLLVDSVPHRSQEWGLDHSPEIDPFSAGEIKVVRGAAGVRYGPGAIGGAILVEEPKLLQAPGIASELHLMGYWDRGGGFAARVQSASEKFPGLAFQIDATGKKLASSSTPDYALQNTASQEWNVGGTLGYKFSDAEYTLSARHYQAKLGVCACLQIESSEDFFAQLERQRPINSELFESDFEIGRPYQSVAHDQLHARATWSLAERGSLSASYALQFDHRKEFAQVRNATGPQFDFRLTTHDAELAWEHRPAYLNDEWHLRGSMGAVGVAQLHSYRGLPLVPDYLATGGGVFAIERLLSDTYELEVGLRYDYLSRRADLLRNDFLRLVRSEQLSPTSCGGSEGGSVSCDSSFHTVSASIGGLIELAESWSLKLDVSTATRPPSPDEQYLNGTSPTFPVLALGKPDIGAETTYSTSLTSVYRGSKFALESSVYANLISDYINFAPALDEMNQPIFDVLIRGTFPRFTTKAVDALFYGADAGALWQPSSSLELGVQASLVRASNRSNGGFLVMVPSDKLRASARYIHASNDGSEKFWISSSGEYTARQDRFNPIADLASPPDAYFLLGAEVGAATKVGNQLVKLSVHGTNLLNTRYREYTSLLRYFADQPGLQLMIRLSLHQGKK